MTRDDIVTTARSWLGVPFMHQGRTRAGVDCLGLAINVGWETGFLPRDYDVQGYGRSPDGRMFGEMSRVLVRIPAPRYGCLVAMRFDKEPQHVAIVGEHKGHLTLIHSLDEGGRKVIETRLTHPWPSRIVGCFDVPGL